MGVTKKQALQNAVLKINCMLQALKKEMSNLIDCQTHWSESEEDFDPLLSTAQTSVINILYSLKKTLL